MEPFFYFAFNADLMANSLKCTRWSEAQKMAERLNAKYPTARHRWIPLSNKPQLTPEQCCGWLLTHHSSTSTWTPATPRMEPTGCDDDDLYC
jgi:hypothetical protein